MAAATATAMMAHQQAPAVRMDDAELRVQLPGSVSGPLAELGPEKPDIMYIHLGDAETRAIEQTLVAFKALEIDGHEISKTNFVLPTAIADKLTRAAVNVHCGNGVCVIRGLDPLKYSDADNLLYFLGLGCYIGDKHGVQDKKRNVISHITDAKAWTVPYEKRHGVHTNQHLTWHCDMGADILALQVRQVASRGGATLVSSSWKTYNDLMEERPDIVKTLCEANWPVHVSDRKSRYILAPLLTIEAGRILLNFDPSRLGAHPAMKAARSGRVIPALTEAQQEALRVLSAAAQRNGVELDTKPGDLVFINNWAVMHARSAYEDADTAAGVASATRRHLLRLWLRNSELGWAIPTSMSAPWEAAFGYTDEGYISGDHEQLAAQLKYAVVPESKYKPARYTTGSAAFVIEDSGSESESESDEE